MSETLTHIEKKKALVPELRFKDFDGEWSSIKLKKRSSLLKDGSHGTHKEVVQSPYFLLSAKNIREGGIEYDESDRRISESDYESIYKNYNLLKDDILLTIVGTIGRVAKYNGLPNLAFQRSVAFFRFEKDVPDFIFQSFQTSSFQRELDKRKVVSAQPGIYLGDLAKISISAPTLPEQQKIASFLSAVDQKIQLLTRKKELLEQYKKGVMQQLFSEQIRFKDADGKEFPEWEEKRLGVLAKAVKKKNTDNAVNFVLTNSATQGIVSQQDYFDKDIANQNNLEGYYVVEVNDFVYNPRISVHAPVGPIKRNKLQQGVMSPLYSIFRFNHTDLDFFELYFETTFWHKYLGNVANFGARHDRMNITVEDFYKMPIPLPCNEERRLITNYLKSISVKLKRANEELEQAQTFKKGLLQKMFV